MVSQVKWKGRRRVRVMMVNAVLLFHAVRIIIICGSLIHKLNKLQHVVLSIGLTLNISSVHSRKWLSPLLAVSRPSFPMAHFYSSLKSSSDHIPSGLPLCTSARKLILSRRYLTIKDTGSFDQVSNCGPRWQWGSLQLHVNSCQYVLEKPIETILKSS